MVPNKPDSVTSHKIVIMGNIFDKLGNVHEYNSYKKNLFAESRYRIVKYKFPSAHIP